MTILTIQEHKSSSYAQRTYHNAAQGITLAVAVNFNTAGERLTHKASKGNIIQHKYGDDKLKCSRLLYSALKNTGCRVINVAGNGIYHFKELGITQEDINQYVYDILKPVAQHIELEKIVSGGQTGADIAGLVAAVALGVYAVGTYPKGFKMRYEKGVDSLCLPGEIGDMVVNYSLKIDTGDSE